MRPSFNIAGPCIPGEHYMLPPERRLGRILELIHEHKYFTLHAGRQTGKTTCALWLTDHLNTSGTFRAVYVDLQTAGDKPDPAYAFRGVLGECDRAFKRDLSMLLRPSAEDRELWMRFPDTALQRYLSTMAEHSDLPLVVFFDEVDGLVGPTTVSLLTQLRAGYIDRQKTPFPASIALIGQRQVRDYVLSMEERRAIAWLGTISPFNITAEATTLSEFTPAEVVELLMQHTTETGQRFEEEAVERIQTLTCGHPWLVNALANEAVSRDVRDRSIAVTAAHIEAAKETIIYERRSHIDSLVHRLREDRVRRILDPMLAGELPSVADTLDDDLAYCVGLGLITVAGRSAQIANPIYREVFPRALTYARQMTLYQEAAWYLGPDGRLDMGALLAGFQEFWRDDGHLAAEGFGYRESGPHLLLMAFLQRVVNGGGRITREYGLGRGSLDLLIEWQGERHVIEVKLRRGEHSEPKGIEQLGRYLDGAGLREGWLVLFDLRSERSWEERLFRRDIEHQGKRIHILGG